MTKKRKLNNGRSAAQLSGHPREDVDPSQPRLDPIYGQRSAFPGLDDPDDELQDEVSFEALAYLRSVRYVHFVPRLSSFALSVCK